MLRIIVLALAIAAASPALATVTMTIENRSTTQTVSGINSFPIDEDGEGIEDNLGGLFDDVPPGSSAKFDLNGDCTLTRFFVRLLEQTGDDLELDVNTCKSRVIVLSD